MRLRTFVAAGLALLAVALSAHAQLRTIPDDARRGQLRHVRETLVEINGAPMQLAAAAQIRDADNRIVLPASLAPVSLVKYKTDAAGLVNRIWILTPVEAAQPDRTR